MDQLSVLALEIQALVKKSEPLVYSVDEVAAILNCHPETVADKLGRGELPGLKYGRSWVLPVQALIQHLNERAVSEAAERRAGRAKQHQEISAASEMVSQLQSRPGRRRKPPPSLDGPYIVLGGLKG